MIGNKHAEIDEFSLTFKKSCHQLSLSLGFNYTDTVIANVWTKNDCGPIEEEK